MKKTHKVDATLICDPTAITSERKRKTKRKRKTTMTIKSQIRPWSDLPSDLLGELMARFSSADQIRFGATCRYYYSLIPTDDDDDQNNKLSSKIDHNRPWLVDYHVIYPRGGAVLVCKLVEPVRQTRPYSVFEITAGKDVLFTDRHCGSAPLLASNHGWLLFQWNNRTGYNRENPYKTSVKSFSLFSPFTRQVISLPDLNLRSVLVCQITLTAAFSSSPAADGCVYFVLGRHTGWSKLVSISTFRRGDHSDWTTLAFDEPEPVDEYCSVVYHEGRFYCASRGGRLAAYDVARRDWEVVISRGGRRQDIISLVVCEGELLRVGLEERFFSDEEICSVFVFSSSTKAWVRKTSLGDYALFLGRASSFVFPTTTATTREVSDRIYYYTYRVGVNAQCRYYSLKDGKCYLDCSNFCDSYATWTEPPQLKVSQLGC